MESDIFNFNIQYDLDENRDNNYERQNWSFEEGFNLIGIVNPFYRKKDAVSNPNNCTTYYYEFKGDIWVRGDICLDYPETATIQFPTKAAYPQYLNAIDLVNKQTSYLHMLNYTIHPRFYKFICLSEKQFNEIKELTKIGKHIMILELFPLLKQEIITVTSLTKKTKEGKKRPNQIKCLWQQRYQLEGLKLWEKPKIT